MLTIKGATTRRDYWIFKLINWAIFAALLLVWVDCVLADTDALTSWLFVCLSGFIIVFFVFYFIAKTTLLIRRFHDLNINTETAVVIIIGKYLTGPIGLLIDLITFGATIFPSNHRPLTFKEFSWKQNSKKKSKKKKRKSKAYNEKPATKSKTK